MVFLAGIPEAVVGGVEAWRQQPSGAYAGRPAAKERAVLERTDSPATVQAALVTYTRGIVQSIYQEKCKLT